MRSVNVNIFSKHRLKGAVHRTRTCNLCGMIRHTVEVVYWRRGLRPFEQRRGLAKFKADRCWKCILGKGKQQIHSSRHTRRIAGRTHRPIADLYGVVIRHYTCDRDCGAKKWITWEYAVNDRLCRDITLCNCGGRMKGRKQ